MEAAHLGIGLRRNLGDAGAMDAKDYLLGFGKQLGYDLTLDEWIASLRASIETPARRPCARRTESGGRPGPLC